MKKSGGQKSRRTVPLIDRKGVEIMEEDEKESEGKRE